MSLSLGSESNDPRSLRRRLLDSPEFQIAADLRCTVGEGPVWHPDVKRLYWTDILSSRIYWYEPASGKSRLCYEGRIVGGMTLQADDSLLLFMDRGTVAVWRDGRIVRTLLDHIPAETDRRFNDVIADPEGRVFAGAMPFKDLERKRGRLYRLERDGSYQVVLEGIGIPNGMAFTSDRRAFYFIDSLDNVVWKFDYDPGTGALGRRRAFLRFDAARDGHADGMTLDQEDNLWIAMAMGGRVLQFGPDGSRKRSIELPAKFTASVAFGGRDLSDLYVTTGNHPEDEDLGPAAGALMVLNPGAVGVPEFRSRIAI